MKQRLIASAIFALLVSFGSAHAQSTSPVILPGGCGTGAATGSLAYLTVDPTLKLCVNATVAASVSGFTPGNTFATLTATGSSASVALPAGTTVAIQNTGTTTVSCTLGIGSATALASEIQVPASSSVFVTPGSNTFGACIDQTGTVSNLVVLAGGSGLGTGFGGGGGGGGSSGAVFGPTAVGTAAANPPVLQGGTLNGTATGAVGVAKVDASGTQFIDCSAAGNTLCGIASSPEPLRAQTQEQAAVTNGTTIPAAADATGKQINLPYANPENFLNGEIASAMTATTSTVLTGMAAQGAGVRVYATACTFSNTHATVGTLIILQDGSGGAVLWQAPAGPAFNGAAVVFPTPIKTTANNGLFAVNATTGSSTFVSCTGYKGA